MISDVNGPRHRVGQSAKSLAGLSQSTDGCLLKSFCDSRGNGYATTSYTRKLHVDIAGRISNGLAVPNYWICAGDTAPLKNAPHAMDKLFREGLRWPLWFEW